MKTLSLALVCLFCLPLFALRVDLSAKPVRGGYQVNLHLPDTALSLKEVSTDSDIFDKLDHEEGLPQSWAGSPDIPRFHRWLVVPSDTSFQLRVKVSGASQVEDVYLAPVATDQKEGTAVDLVADSEAYGKNKWYGGETAVIGKPARLGSLTILPLTITPIQYNPVSRQLRSYRDVTATIVYGEENRVLRTDEITDFSLAQARALTLNGNQIELRSAGGANLIVTTQDLLPWAQRLGALRPNGQYNVVYEVLPSGISAADLRARILAKYPSGGLNSVLLFGDEKRIPLYFWTTYTPGDSYYSLLWGNDNVADVSIGRLPVSSEKEAELIVSKIENYTSLAAGGMVNKKVMLVAHGEEYPGKYTANQETIRKAANPKGFQFTAHYGGAGALNADVIRDANAGFSIVNYRGHGSASEWWTWDKSGSSFAYNEAAKLDLLGEKFPVFFNIACDNGALQNDYDSLSERLLFPISGEAKGAVAVLGSTDASYTETNHRFDIHIFKYLQDSKDISLGSVIAYAANKLVQEEGGAMPENNKMYILFSDPLLSPWLPN